MIRANKTKGFFIVLFAVLLTIYLISLQMDNLQFESSQLANFLISKNAIKCIEGDRVSLTKEELEDIMRENPHVVILTLQNRASFRCLGFYSKNVNYFDKYLVEGRFFRPEEVNEKSNKIVAGKNILNSSVNTVSITKKGSKTYAEIDEVVYEIIGVIGSEISSSLDNLVIFSSPNGHFMYYLDSENPRANQKAFQYVQEKYGAEELEEQSSLMDSVIKTDIQFEILGWIQFGIKMLLIIVLAYLSYKMNQSMLRAQYLMGLPLSFAVSEASKNIFAASLAALAVIFIVMGVQQVSIKEALDIVYRYVMVTAFLLLIQLLSCVITYCGWNFNQILSKDRGDKNDNA